MIWQEKLIELYEKECQYIRQNFPDVIISEINKQIVLSGLFPVYNERHVKICQVKLRVIFPFNYPSWIPEVCVYFAVAEGNPDRHIDRGGRACLCLYHEVLHYLPDGITFKSFWNNLLKPWLVGQAFYEEKGHWPGPERKHGKEGIIEGFSELLHISDVKSIERFIVLIISEKEVPEYEKCPCGRGKLLVNCHYTAYKESRDSIDPTSLSLYRKYYSIRN